MSQTSKRVLALGTAAIVLGAALSLLLPSGQAPKKEEAAVRTPRPARMSEQLVELNQADSVPKKQQAANDYIEDRWKHIGTPETLPQIGPGGERRYQLAKVVVGLARGGKPIYGRMFAQVNPERFTLVDKDTPLKVGPSIKVKDFKPGPLWSRLQGMNKELNQAGNKLPGGLGSAPTGSGELKNSDNSGN